MTVRLFERREELLRQIRQIEDEIREKLLLSKKYWIRDRVRIVSLNRLGVIDDCIIEFNGNDAWVVYEVDTDEEFFDCREDELELK